MHCPLDQTPFKFEQLGSHITHRCEACSGIFLLGDYFREVRAKAVFEAHSRKSNSLNNTTQHMSRIDCPNDSNPMMLFSFKGIEIDVCLYCYGVWLDQGEYEKITAHIGRPQTNDLSKIGANMGALNATHNFGDIEISSIGDIVELVSDIFSFIPDISI